MRIASLVPSPTELLFALDLGNSVVARTGFCIHPRERTRRIPKVGGTKDVDIDALLATQPTHLIVNVDENRKDTIVALRARVPEIVVTHPLVPDDNLDLYREFGRLFDRSTEAAALAAEYSSAQQELTHAACAFHPLKVIYLIWKAPRFTVSRSTYVSSLLASANLHTVPAVSAARYPILTGDDPAWREADLILLPSEPFKFRQKHADELARALPVPKPVLLIDGEMLSWYGSRAIAGLHYLKDLSARLGVQFG